jgi:hypothetical protein
MNLGCFSSRHGSAFRTVRSNKVQKRTGAEDTGVADAMAGADVDTGVAKATGTDTAGADIDMAATETGTDTVAAAGGMVAGGHMGSAPVGDSGPVVGSGFATERPD